MKIKVLGNKKGFSLVELMVVVAIIGILTSIAVPKFQSFRAKAIRAEANASLTNINTLNQLYYTENDAYTSNFGLLGFSYNKSASKYDYTISSANGQVYTATALSKQKLCPAAEGRDEIITEDDGELSIVVNGLTNCG